MVIATNVKGKKEREYKKVVFHKREQQAPQSSEQAQNPPPLKEEELKYHKLNSKANLKKMSHLRGGQREESVVPLNRRSLKT